MTQDQDAFEARCREALRARADAVDGRASSRLNQARQAALAELVCAAGSRPFRVPGIWLPAGTLAAAAVLVMAVWIARPVSAPAVPLAEVTALEDAEILSSNEGPELYADDADFYDWVGDDNAGGTG